MHNLQSDTFMEISEPYGQQIQGTTALPLFKNGLEYPT